MNEIMIPLQNHSRKALYEQIYEYIRQDIADGKISRGEKLPSTRLLARHLQVSRSTVELAYEQLLSEGYIEAEPYRGYFASDITDLYQITGEVPKEPEQEIERSGGGEEETVRIDFNPYRVDLANFPYNAWKKENRNAWMEPEEMFQTGDKKGERDLRREIARYLHQARGVECKESQVIVGAGNEYLLLLLAQLLGQNRTVVMENPTYMQAYRIFQNMHYQVRTADMDENGLKVEDVKKNDSDVVYVMPSHQFPLGIVMSMKRRLELLKWAMDKEERYIIEDDHDSEFRYKGKPIPSLQSIDRGNRVIYLGTFSKSIASAIRVGYMVLPVELLKRYEETCGFYAATVAKYQQEVLYHFMASGNFERHLNRMRGIYRTKHDYLVTELKKRDWVERIYGDNAGLHVLVEVRTDLSEKELMEAMGERQVKIYGLSEHYIDKCQWENSRKYPTILLGYGNLSEEEIKEGLKELDEELQ